MSYDTSFPARPDLLDRANVPIERYASRSRADILFPLLVPFLLGLAIAGSCYAASGASLGLFFGPVLLVTFLVPPLAMGENGVIGRLLICISLAVGICSAWLIAGNLSAMDAGRCAAVLGAYILALAGAAAFLERLRLGKIFASGAIVLLGFLWLTWPVWLSPWLNGPHAQAAVDRLTTAHPLMAMNAILFTRFNFWDRYTLSYQQLTILNQDVLYTLPRTVIWMVLVHLMIGAGGLIWDSILRIVWVLWTRRTAA